MYGCAIEKLNFSCRVWQFLQSKRMRNKCKRHEKVFFLKPLIGYSCSICSYMYAHPSYTRTSHMYKQIYNYTQIRISFSFFRSLNSSDSVDDGCHISIVLMRIGKFQTETIGNTVPGGTITRSSALEP